MRRREEIPSFFYLQSNLQIIAQFTIQLTIICVQDAKCMYNIIFERWIFARIYLIYVLRGIA